MTSPYSKLGPETVSCIYDSNRLESFSSGTTIYDRIANKNLKIAGFVRPVLDQIGQQMTSNSISTATLCAVLFNVSNILRGKRDCTKCCLSLPFTPEKRAYSKIANQVAVAQAALPNYPWIKWRTNVLLKVLIDQEETPNNLARLLDFFERGEVSQVGWEQIFFNDRGLYQNFQSEEVFIVFKYIAAQARFEFTANQKQHITKSIENLNLLMESKVDETVATTFLNFAASEMVDLGIYLGIVGAYCE